MARRLGNISRETIPLLILFVAQQKPSRGGLWHPILMQFYSGPLMQLLSGVDTAGSTCPTPPLTSCVRFHRERSSRISTLAPLLPSSASSSVKPRSSEARKRRAVRGKSTTCSKSAEAGPLATLAGRHRTGSTALSVGSDSPRRARRRKAWPCGPPPPAAAGLTAPRPPQSVPPSDQ